MKSVKSTLHGGGEGQNAGEHNFPTLMAKVVDSWFNVLSCFLLLEKLDFLPILL